MTVTKKVTIIIFSKLVTSPIPSLSAVVFPPRGPVQTPDTMGFSASSRFVVGKTSIRKTDLSVINPSMGFKN